MNSPDTWKAALSSRTFTAQLAAFLVSLAIVAFFIGDFFTYIESVAGTPLTDPILNLLPAYNLSVPIFTIIYAAILVALVHLGTHPFLLRDAAAAYVLLNVMRMTTLLLFPLEPDPEIIPLEDPFVQLFFYGGQVITKDLFFSGHVSVLALLGFSSTRPAVKLLLFAAATTVAVMLLFQHAHYTIDVLAAPGFAWLSVRIARTLISRG